jgi:hypothetical protein
MCRNKTALVIVIRSSDVSPQRWYGPAAGPSRRCREFRPFVVGAVRGKPGDGSMAEFNYSALDRSGVEG